MLPEVLDDNASFSVNENDSFVLDTTRIIKNGLHYFLEDTDDDAATTVSADGKRYISPELNITLNETNATLRAGNVESTLWRSFGINATDGADHAAGATVNIEIVDAVDDRPVILSDLSVTETVALGGSATLQGALTDADGMQSATVTLLDDQNVTVDTFYAYPGTDATRIDLNVTVADLEAGLYSFALRAEGNVGGEGERSLFEARYGFSVSAPQSSSSSSAASSSSSSSTAASSSASSVSSSVSSSSLASASSSSLPTSSSSSSSSGVSSSASSAASSSSTSSAPQSSSSISSQSSSSSASTSSAVSSQSSASSASSVTSSLSSSSSSSSSAASSSSVSSGTAPNLSEIPNQTPTV